MSVSRRGFLQTTGAGLVLAFFVPSAIKAAPKAAATPAPPPPNAFVRIGADDSVTVILAHAEMGQGMWTGLAMLIAEELECDWSKVTSEHAPANVALYARNGRGVQMTGGSSSIRSEFDRYRTVGASAKDMLVRAAAARWKVAPSACRVAQGVISHGGKTLRFGEVAEEAMKLAPPAKVTLKKPGEWKLIGTDVKRLDSVAKITGAAQFGMDIQFPGLRTAVIARPPAFGAKLASFDAKAALGVAGVEQVVAVPAGVAVVAKHYWAAKLGRDALVVTWTDPPEPFDTRAYSARLRELVAKPGVEIANAGKIDAALGGAASVLDAIYEVPYLAHAPMEPLNCAVKLDGDRVEIWTGTQFQSVDQQVAAGIAGTTVDKVQIHTTFLGGGFGRRANPQSDFVAEAVHVAKAAKVPVKVVWTREDDIRGGYYRPAFVHRMRVGVGADGKPVAWDHTTAGQSIMAGTPFAAMMKDGIDPASVEGLAESPYLGGVGAKRVTLHSPTTPVPVQWWRSVGNTHTAFAIECMIDELAHAAGKDPLAYRLALLAGSPRQAAALKLAADKASWATPPAAGRARGLAVHECFGTIVAEVAEVSIEDRRIRVHAVTAAVDCGTAVSPLSVEAQVQSSIAYGLTAALHGKLTIERGRVLESNFHDYPPLRMFEMPKVAVHLIASGAPMGGIGEPATAPIAPAVANAVFALTRKRQRTLPLEVA